MTDKNQAHYDGYVRGLEGKSTSASSGDVFKDSTVNESGSTQAREEGWIQGLKDAAFIEKQKSN